MRITFEKCDFLKETFLLVNTSIEGILRIFFFHLVI